MMKTSNDWGWVHQTVGKQYSLLFGTSKEKKNSIYVYNVVFSIKKNRKCALINKL